MKAMLKYLQKTREDYIEGKENKVSKKELDSLKLKNINARKIVDMCRIFIKKR